MKWLLVLILGWVHQGYASSLHCEVGAPVAIVIDAESGKVLFEKNAKIPCYPASTTKIATALYTLCRRGGDLHQKVIASQDAIATVSSSIRRNSGKHPSYRLEFGGTHIGIRVGEILSLETLLYGLMLASGNDAANVLAESVSGTVSRFMEELNGFLQQIGCKATHFTNPHGLPDVDHRTTAWDLARMALVAMKIPAFRTIVSSKQFEREETNKQQASFLMQGNGLLRPGSKHFYPYATGIKTGYTGQSGYNLVASASKNGRNIIAVVCQCEDLSKRYRSVHQLFDMVFQELKQTRKLLCREHDSYRHFIEGGKGPVEAVLQEDVEVSFYPSEETVFSPRVTWFEKELPIMPGEEVGYLQLLTDTEHVEKQVALLAKNYVEPTWQYLVHKKIENLVLLGKKSRRLFGYGLAAGLLLGSIMYLRRKPKHKKALQG